MPSEGWRKGNPTIQVERTCYFCGGKFKIWPSVLGRHKDKARIACSRKCRNEHLSRWIDDRRYKSTSGYIMVPKEGNPKSSKLRDMVYEHRVIAEQILGRKLATEEEIHHLNGKRDDNRPENLLVVDSRKHKHSPRAPSIVVCPECSRHIIVTPIEGMVLGKEIMTNA